MTWLWGLIPTRARIWGFLVTAGIGLLAIGAVVIRQDARRDQKQKGRIDDYENAEDIRDRVRNDPPNRVREFDGAGWRDDGN